MALNVSITLYVITFQYLLSYITVAHSFELTQMVSVDDDDLAGLEDISSNGEDDSFDAEHSDDGTDSEIIEATLVRRPSKKKSRGKSYLMIMFVKE